MRFQPVINLKHPAADLLSGVIVALVSIPISMGYAQIAGLPAVYGLYGSLLPILLFGLLTSSPQFVVGVDAMPAVMVGSAFAGMGLTLGSAEAVALVPVITLCVGVWFLIFWIFRAGRVVKYISTPVMGGFISGIGATIILMQVPKLFGGAPGTGELFALLAHIAAQAGAFHPLSAALGFGTVIVILVSKRLWPKFPMPVVMMVLGVLLTAVCHVDRLGVALLPAVESGLPRLVIPDVGLLAGRAQSIVVLSLTIALVVMAQTLLATNSYAQRYDYPVDNRRELLAYAVMELAACAAGCCPVNGSVSRSGMADQFGCRSQLMSVAASAVMLLVLLFGTPFLRFLPVPVLTGIVAAALIGILEIKMARNLLRVNRREFFIFAAAFFGVLVFGTVGGVVIGVVLSFFAVVVRAVVPPKAYLGMIPGHEDFYNLERNRAAHPIAHTVIYRFSGNLFFANVGAFREDILAAVRPDTKQVIVDGRGIANIDITAAERVLLLEKSLRERGVHLYLTEHVGAVNDQLRQYGAEALLERGVVRRTIPLALEACGLQPPYPLDCGDEACPVPQADEGQYAEFEWLYGADAEEKLSHMADTIAQEIAAEPETAIELAEAHAGFGLPGLFDEDALFDHIEMRLEQMELSPEKLAALEARIERSREKLEEHLRTLDPEIVASLQRHRERMKTRHPEHFQRLEELKRKAKNTKSGE